MAMRSGWFDASEGMAIRRMIPSTQPYIQTACINLLVGQEIMFGNDTSQILEMEVK
jgi:hypothetical protein